jgi:hypothetical protein
LGRGGGGFGFRIFGGYEVLPVVVVVGNLGCMEAAAAAARCTGRGWGGFLWPGVWTGCTEGGFGSFAGVRERFRWRGKPKIQLGE